MEGAGDPRGRVARSDRRRVETGCRQGEMLLIQNDWVDWRQHHIRIPAGVNKCDIERDIPFDPNGRLATILQKRRFVGGPKGHVFGEDARFRKKSRRSSQKWRGCQTARRVRYSKSSGWALGSAVEHRLHTAGVSGSNPLAPTNLPHRRPVSVAGESPAS
jgi:hypothetical protein